MIDRDTIDRIYAAADIVDIVGDYVTLKRKGVNYEACCPFHQEKTPSFKVSPARGIYKCFGCGKSGNAVNFVMESENISYPEALRLVAKRYGIEVKEEAQSEEQIERNNNRESMFALNQWAAEYFQRYMFSEDEGRSIALSYFSSVRGFSDATIRKFGLGFCPTSGSRFSDDARSAGYKEEFLLSTGLSIKRESDGKLRDRFYDRVIFPVHNVSGRVVAFGGRTLRTDKKVAKYQNSPESDVYSKSKELYGLYFAKRAIQQQDLVIMVEGYADVISMHQAGVENVVASSGTSLTEEQIRLVGRFSRNITLMFDGDAAGVKAALRGVDMILKEGLNVRIVLLPEEHDPDTFARTYSHDELCAYIKDNSQDFLAFKARLLLGEANNDPIRRTEAIRDVVESLSLISDNIKRAEYIRYCSEVMSVNEQILAVDVARKRDDIRGNREAQEFLRRQQSREQSSLNSSPRVQVDGTTITGGSTIETLERDLAKYLIKYGHLYFDVLDEDSHKELHYNVASYIFHEIDSDDLSFYSPVYRTIYELYRSEWQRLGDGVEVPTHSFVNNSDPEVCGVTVDLLTSDDNYVISRIWEQKEVHVESDEEQLAEAVPKAVTIFKWRTIDMRIEELRKQLVEASSREDEDSVSQIVLQLSKYQHVRKTIATISGRLL